MVVRLLKFSFWCNLVFYAALIALLAVHPADGLFAKVYSGMLSTSHLGLSPTRLDFLGLIASEGLRVLLVYGALRFARRRNFVFFIVLQTVLFVYEYGTWGTVPYYGLIVLVLAVLPSSRRYFNEVRIESASPRPE